MITEDPDCQAQDRLKIRLGRDYVRTVRPKPGEDRELCGQNSNNTVERQLMDFGELRIDLFDSNALGLGWEPNRFLSGNSHLSQMTEF